MNKPALPRLGAACGAIFAIGLTIAAGDGSQSFSSTRAVAGIAAITLALPFIAYLCSLSAWVTISEETGMAHQDAQRGIAWALDVLVADLRRESTSEQRSAL